MYISQSWYSISDSHVHQANAQKALLDVRQIHARWRSAGGTPLLNAMPITVVAATPSSCTMEESSVRHALHSSDDSFMI